jgi:hypothetical protein
MEKLFGRAWLILGHESQVNEPGDFFTTRLGDGSASSSPRWRPTARPWRRSERGRR